MPRIPAFVIRRARAEEYGREAEAYYGPPRAAKPEDADICTCGHRRDDHVFGDCICGCKEFQKKS